MLGVYSVLFAPGVGGAHELINMLARLSSKTGSHDPVVGADPKTGSTLN